MTRRYSTLREVFPERFQALWDQSAAGNPDPATLAARCLKTIHLRCDTCGHRWTTTPHDIFKTWTAGRSGCAGCAKRIPKSKDDYHALAAARGFKWIGPQVANTSTPTQWQCSKGHLWRSRYAAIKRGAGCTKCEWASRKLRRQGTPQRNLRTEFPKIADEWHPNKNGSLQPANVLPGSNKRVWWQCARRHEWQTLVLARTSGTNCPYCSSQTSRAELRVLAEIGGLLQPVKHRTKVSGREVDVLLPVHRVAIEVDGWHHRGKEAKDRAKNVILRQAGLSVLRVRDKNLPRLSRNDVAIDFGDGLGITDVQSLVRRIARIARSRLTPDETATLDRYCARSEFTSDARFEELAEVLPGPTKDRSLNVVAPQMAAQWHPSRNGARLTPQNVSAYSKLKLWWQCESGHEWQATPHDRMNGGRTLLACPFCPKAKTKLTNRPEESLAARFPEFVAEWHPTKNAGLDPQRLRPFSGAKAWWICPKGHEYQRVIAARTRQGQGCGYCSGHRVGSDNNLAAMHPVLAKEWHPSKNGQLRPAKVNPGTEQKVWWVCGHGHEWQASVKSRSRLHSGCPVCWAKRRIVVAKTAWSRHKAKSSS